MQFKIRNIVSGSITGGQVSVFEETTAPGEGPPLHSHVAQIEVFHILKGRYTFVVNGKETVAGPGDCLVVPAGAPHTFKNIDASESVMHFELLPSGTSEAFFDRIVADFAGIADVPAFFKQHGLELLGPPIQ